MNIIGLMGPKLVSLLMTLIPEYETKHKLLLVCLWFLKLIVDYDTAKPGHRGNIYKLTKNVEFEVGELIVAGIQFIPALAFLMTTVILKTWISAIPGTVAAIINFVSILGCIKDVIIEKRRRKERNANSNYKK